MKVQKSLNPEKALAPPAFLEEAVSGSPGNQWVRHSLALLIYVGLTLLLTWPLVLKLNQAVPGASNLDSDQNIWNLWWFKTALLDRHTNPYYTDLLYYPYWSKGLPLVFHNLQPLNGLIALPVTVLGGPIMAFNFIAFFAFTATAFNTYLLGLHLLKNWQAALLTGVLFSYAPLHLGYFHFSNMETMSLEWVPLYVLCLHLWTGQPLNAKPKIRYVVLAGLFFLANILTNWYFTLHIVLYTALWLIWLLIKERQVWRTVVARFFWLGIACAGFAAPVLWLIWKAFRVQQDFVLVKGLNEEISWSATPWSFLYSEKLTDFNPPQWGIYFFGYVAIFLAACALLGKPRRGWWWLVMLVFMVLALGPYLRLDHSPRSTTTTGIPLPYLLLRELPLISISRIVGRFYFVADLATAVLAGYGFLKLKGWLEKQKLFSKFNFKRFDLAFVTALLCLWVLEVQTVPVVMYSPQPDAFYNTYLKDKPGHEALLEIPIPKTNEYSHTRMLNQVYTARPILGGYLSRPLVDYYRSGASPFHLVLSPSELTAPPLAGPDFVQTSQQLTLPELLSYYNFGYVVLYNQEFGSSQLSATLKTYQALFNAPVYRDNEVTAFKAPAPLPLSGPRLYCGESWYGAEAAPDGSGFRWVKNGAGFVGLLAPNAGQGRLSFQAWAFGQDSEVSVLVNGVEKTRLNLTPVPTPYQLDISWGSGVNSLEFKTNSPGKSPGNGDERQLTFALKNIGLA